MRRLPCAGVLALEQVRHDVELLGIPERKEVLGDGKPGSQRMLPLFQVGVHGRTDFGLFLVRRDIPACTEPAPVRQPDGVGMRRQLHGAFQQWQRFVGTAIPPETFGRQEVGGYARWRVREGNLEFPLCEGRSRGVAEAGEISHVPQHRDIRGPQPCRGAAASDEGVGECDGLRMAEVSSVDAHYVACDVRVVRRQLPCLRRSQEGIVGAGPLANDIPARDLHPGIVGPADRVLLAQPHRLLQSAVAGKTDHIQPVQRGIVGVLPDQSRAEIHRLIIYAQVEQV